MLFHLFIKIYHSKKIKIHLYLYARLDGLTVTDHTSSLPQQQVLMAGLNFKSQTSSVIGHTTYIQEDMPTRRVLLNVLAVEIIRLVGEHKLVNKFNHI